MQFSCKDRLKKVNKKPLWNFPTIMKRISLPSPFMVILFNFNFKLLYSPFFSMMAQKVIQRFYLAMERCEPLTGN